MTCSGHRQLSTGGKPNGYILHKLASGQSEEMQRQRKWTAQPWCASPASPRALGSLYPPLLLEPWTSAVYLQTALMPLRQKVRVWRKKEGEGSVGERQRYGFSRPGEGT